MIGTQSYASNPILLLVHLCLKQQLQPPSATVIHRRLSWFPSPSVSFIIAGRAAAATVSFWSRRINHRQRKVLCHAYRIFLSIIYYYISDIFIRSSGLGSRYFYPQLSTWLPDFFIRSCGRMTSGYFYPQLSTWLPDFFIRSCGRIASGYFYL